MKLLRRLWYRCLLASYRHDLLMAEERRKNAEQARAMAMLNINFAEHVLRELEKAS